MRVRIHDDSLIVQDGPSTVLLMGAGGIFLGTCLSALPWILESGSESKKVLLAKVGFTLLGVVGAILGTIAIVRNPTIVTRFDRDEKSITVQRWLFRLTSHHQISFRMLESVSVGQRRTDSGDLLHRITLCTRDGERIPITGWKPDSEDMREVTRKLGSWMGLTTKSPLGAAGEKPY